MKVVKWLDKYLEEVLLTAMLIAISVIMIAQVISRYIFNASLSWSDELARYLLVWSCFLSISYCVKRRISIKIEQLQNALPKKAIPWLRLIRHTIVFAYCVIMIPYAWTYLQQAVASGATSAAMQIPMSWIQSAPLVGFILLAIRVAQAWVREFKIAVLHYPDIPKNANPDQPFPKEDEPGEIWLETQLTKEEEYESREALGTLKNKSSRNNDNNTNNSALRNDDQETDRFRNYTDKNGKGGKTK